MVLNSVAEGFNVPPDFRLRKSSLAELANDAGDGLAPVAISAPALQAGQNLGGLPDFANPAPHREADHNAWHGEALQALGPSAAPM
ncbi:hypothetical protein NKH02_14950 [Mesorhizobium sp. M1396]